MIAWKAYKSGLSTCGIIDHESVGWMQRISGGVPHSGCGAYHWIEIRLNWNHTPLKDKMFNDPDQKSLGYFPIHGVACIELAEIEKFFTADPSGKILQESEMVKNIDSILRNYGLGLDFESDVIPVSKWTEAEASPRDTFCMPRQENCCGSTSPVRK